MSHANDEGCPTGLFELSCRRRNHTTGFACQSPDRAAKGMSATSVTSLLHGETGDADLLEGVRPQLCEQLADHPF